MPALAASTGLTRRQVLATAATLALGGCAPLLTPPRPDASGATTLVLRPASPLAVVHSGPKPLAADAEYYRLVPHLADQFNATHPGMAIATGHTYRRGTASVYALAGVSGWGVDGFASTVLDSALHARNFDPTIVQSGLLDGYRAENGLFGLPVSQAPVAVRWRKDVFRLAGLGTPAPDWTIADFQAACVELQTVVGSGKVRGLQAVLYPPGGYVLGPYCCWGVLFDPAWWTAFSLGYGGTITENGVFALDGRALEGLSVLVDIIRRFSPATGGAGVPASAYPDAFALAVDFWGPPGGADPAAQIHTFPAVAPVLRYGPEWAWARLPRFPARPVITTLPNGEGLTLLRGAAPDERQLEMAVEALLWLHSSDAQRLLEAWGAVPVLADAEAQRQFWERQAPEDQAVGDWRNFIGYGPDWPGPVNESLMSAALMRAVGDPSQLEAAIALAVEQMNATLAQGAGA